MEKSFLNPVEITEAFIEVGCKKASMRSLKLFLLGILGGAYIAFAAEGSNMAIHTIASAGIAKALAGALFATGLMLVVVAGGELFTGNALMVIACSEGRSGWRGLVRNWFFVYTGNFTGSMLIVLLILHSGQFDFSQGMLGGFTIKTAVYKTDLTFVKALAMGILCNWLVCLAVWMSYAAKDITGKLLAIFFPIWLFITSGFEHSVANMYYVPAGILAKGNAAWAAAAVSLGAAPEKIAGLDWGSFFMKNLFPVTLGNIIGGSFFVGVMYWTAYLYTSKKEIPATGCKDK